MASTVRLGAFAACALATFAPSGLAQFAGPGLTWSGSSGAFAGSMVPSCTVFSVSATGGEIVTITVWGDHHSAFGLFAAADTGKCQPFRGVTGGLLLEPPFLLALPGVLHELTPCLSCPPALAPLRLRVPVGIPTGAELSLQALGFGGGVPAFTAAITAAFK